MSPLVPPEVDLKDFPKVPVARLRLFASDFHANANDAEWRAGMTLWLKAWDQSPGGSLPSDDVNLCRLAELGRDLKSWLKVKAMALRGWVEASDHRLYHRVVAEFVLEAWLEKLALRLSSGAGNAKRWNMQFDPAPIEEQIHVARQMLFALNPQSKALSKRKPPGVQTGIPTGQNNEGENIPTGCQQESKTDRNRSEVELKRSRTESELQNRDVGVTPTDSAREKAEKSNGAIENKGNSTTENFTPVAAAWWKTKAGVQATAETIGMRQAQNEDDNAFKDRVYGAVEERRRQALVAQSKRH